VKNKGFVYFPDTRFETKTGKVYLFEVMDTEVRSQAQVIAHVVEACLTPQVEKLTDTIVSNLSDARGDSIFKRVRFCYVIVTPKEAKSKVRVLRALAETREIPGLRLLTTGKHRRGLPTRRRKVRRRAQ
jgi:hypothetical protein